MESKSTKTCIYCKTCRHWYSATKYPKPTPNVCFIDRHTWEDDNEDFNNLKEKCESWTFDTRI